MGNDLVKSIIFIVTRPEGDEPECNVLSEGTAGESKNEPSLFSKILLLYH